MAYLRLLRSLNIVTILSERRIALVSRKLRHIWGRQLLKWQITPFPLRLCQVLVMLRQILVWLPVIFLHLGLSLLERLFEVILRLEKIVSATPVVANVALINDWQDVCISGAQNWLVIFCSHLGEMWC